MGQEKTEDLIVSKLAEEVPDFSTSILWLCMSPTMFTPHDGITRSEVIINDTSTGSDPCIGKTAFIHSDKIVSDEFTCFIDNISVIFPMREPGGNFLPVTLSIGISNANFPVTKHASINIYRVRRERICP